MGGDASARGTSNSNQRGSSLRRRERRAYLVKTYRADVTLDGVPACRCYRCGTLLTEETVQADRIKPGAAGGTYERSNIRPACGPCNITTGHAVQAAERARRKKAT